jgi:chromosome segregation ATPase
MNKFGQAVHAAELMISLLQEAQLEAETAKEDANDSAELEEARALMQQARAELDKTSGSLVSMRNLWLEATRELDKARAMITSQRDSLVRQNDELNRAHDKLKLVEQSRDAAERNVNDWKRKWDELRHELAASRLDLSGKLDIARTTLMQVQANFLSHEDEQPTEVNWDRAVSAAIVEVIEQGYRNSAP